MDERENWKCEICDQSEENCTCDFENILPPDTKQIEKWICEICDQNEDNCTCDNYIADSKKEKWKCEICDQDVDHCNCDDYLPFNKNPVPTYDNPTVPYYENPTVPLYNNSAVIYENPTVPFYHNPTVPTYENPTVPLYDNPTAPRTVCPYFQKNACKFGQNCFNLHVIEKDYQPQSIAELIDNVNGILNNDTDRDRDRLAYYLSYLHRFTWTTNDIGCALQELEDNDIKKEFLLNVYKYVTTEKDYNSILALLYNLPQVDPSKQKSVKKKQQQQQVCPFFLKDGQCPFNECNFSHENVEAMKNYMIQRIKHQIAVINSEVVQKTEELKVLKNVLRQKK